MPEKRRAPAVDTPSKPDYTRAAVHQWLVIAGSELMPPPENVTEGTAYDFGEDSDKSHPRQCALGRLGKLRGKRRIDVSNPGSKRSRTVYANCLLCILVGAMLMGCSTMQAPIFYPNARLQQVSK